MSDTEVGETLTQEWEDPFMNVNTVFDMYFFACGQFNWDSAKEIVEIESSTKFIQHSGTLKSMLGSLSRLCTAEKNYMALNFLTDKGSNKKDP